MSASCQKQKRAPVADAGDAVAATERAAAVLPRYV